MNAIELACHEFDARAIFDEHGLTPFFACDARIKDGGGSQAAAFETDDERWVVKLYYQDSGVVPPRSGVTPTGTDWHLQEPREFRLAIARHPDEDGPGEQDFNCHIQPRWQGMQVENSNGEISEFSVPDGIEEAISVRIQGSNIHFKRYLDILRKAVDAVGINAQYFDKLHEYSSIQDAERYVRLDKDKSGPVHARDGPIVQLAHLLEHDRQGYRKLVQNDQDEHGRNLPGYYHTATLDQRRLQEAFPDHDIPKEIKHYYAREARSLDDHPLADPKVGASYQTSLDDGKIDFTDDAIDQLIYELDQTVLSVLADAGIDIHPSSGSGPFVPDAYFPAETTHDAPEAVDLDLTRIKHDQGSIVIEHIADGLSPVQWEALETLVTDGGDVAPKDIADDHDRHVGSVRRALRNMEDLVHREYARVSLQSDHIAEMVHQAVKEARKANQRAAEASAKAIHAAKSGMEKSMRSFIVWAAKHDIDVDDALNERDVRMTMRAGDFKGQQTARAIREGFRIWCDAGLDGARFREAKIKFADGSQADAWQFLKKTR